MNYRDEAGTKVATSVSSSEEKKKTTITGISQNVVVEWLTILLRIREVPGLNLRPKTGCPEVFCGFLHSFQANARTVP
jgi:hypothetical protein